MHILVVEDERALCDTIVRSLKSLYPGGTVKAEESTENGTVMLVTLPKKGI